MLVGVNVKYVDMMIISIWLFRQMPEADSAQRFGHCCSVRKIEMICLNTLKNLQ